MIFKKDNASNITSVAVIILLIISVIFITALAGCKTQTGDGVEPDVTDAVEDGDRITDDDGDDMAAGDDEDKVRGTEIIGDINILSGLEISDTVNNSRPVAVMVENSPDSRPQSGLINADIVFEVVDEGGVTRYVAVFSSNDADIIGPVRSARIYYAEIARSFDPIYTFWGTYPECFDAIKTMDMDVLDANQMGIVPSTDSGWRDYNRSSITEHTAFMSIDGIMEDASGAGYSLDGGQSPLRFKIDAVDSEKGDISDVSINFSSEGYKVDFAYDSESNEYLKYIAGSAHKDYDTGKQISVNNVIVMITNIDGPIDEAGHMVVRTTGTSDNGKAFFFMDGNVIEGTWERNSIFEPFTFRDGEGSVVLFNRGSTWVSMIQSEDRVSY